MDDTTRTHQSPPRRTPRGLTRSLAAVTVVASTLLVAACGGDSSAAPATSSTSPAATTTAGVDATTMIDTTTMAPAVTSTTVRADATTTSTTAIITTTTATPATIEVLAKDYAYSGLPATIAAGSRISLTTEAGAEPHEITFMRVKDSDTRSFAELTAAIAALPPDQLPPMLELPFALWIFSLPGETDSAILAGDGTLRAGRYTYFDTIHVGATFDSVEAYQRGMETQGDSPMHATLGMDGWLTVE